ncbi:MAG: DUF134 domain-containing protein [Candidatus Thorarchaeota archaeon]
MHRRRKGRRGRFPIQPTISKHPVAKKMNPEPSGSGTPIFINLAEAEVLRLVDLTGMYQEQAGAAMGVSRGTVWRLLSIAREKMVRAMFEGRPIIIGLPDGDAEY